MNKYLLLLLLALGMLTSCGDTCKYRTTKLYISYLGNAEVSRPQTVNILELENNLRKGDTITYRGAYYIIEEKIQ